MILNQESESGIRVENLVVYYDNNPKLNYDGLKQSGDMLIKTNYDAWSYELILEYILNRDLYTLQLTDDEKPDEFKDKDWNSFNPEQILFQDNTIYICVY